MAVDIKMRFPRLNRIIKGLDRLSEEQNKAMARVAFQGAEEIAGEAKELCPVDLGNLRSSIAAIELNINQTGWATGVRAGSTAVPYAEIVHETPHSQLRPGTVARRRAQGTQWKYIETPFRARIRGIEKKMVLAMREANRRAFR